MYEATRADANIKRLCRNKKGGRKTQKDVVRRTMMAGDETHARCGNVSLIMLSCKMIASLTPKSLVIM